MRKRQMATRVDELEFELARSRQEAASLRHQRDRLAQYSSRINTAFAEEDYTGLEKAIQESSAMVLLSESYDRHASSSSARE